MNGDDSSVVLFEDDRSEAPITRLGRHTIGLWLAAEKSGILFSCRLCDRWSCTSDGFWPST